MNRPIHPPIADDDIGPLDEHGQQMWSAEEEAAIARIDADPDYRASLERANAQIDRGECFTTEEVRAHLAQTKRRWLAERGQH